jgi:hypothetical protein
MWGMSEPSLSDKQALLVSMGAKEQEIFANRVGNQRLNGRNFERL